ncbi:NAD(P)-dependent dehydrogenase (short-subunit alcohol dehydrogenase family) [Flavobacterium sp. CG_23.5]|uniref:SDR family oxidoreductase n=1 Tax=unclassified Flavobacterium TaxID=196869 RepID=UPI0018C93F48|nr:MULTISPECIES: SDR family oxidoreductase [unclassified Flavobacterium]MBG6109867.1 NAD(P)-dependent dehydrogenase (short-subunit alcohol dehydrogenase family) [Flavobacterium sp. CG_9.10]MBP2283109.1 NAD(P)-dependent dehydrogenase (short-subunit alcohol dehydrogenase family) [Flavobacterium sp. CG_23.5]
MIIITGASKGIGKYLAEEYSKKDINVFGIYNSTFIESTHPKTVFFKVDTTKDVEIKSWIENNQSDLKEITLINCAGINYNSFAHKADIQKWREVIEVNLIGTFNMISSLLPFMREQSFGRIINFGSVVAELPSPGVSAYAASKSALFGMSKSIAIENASKGVTINNINLGYSELGMISEVPEKFLEDIKKRIPSNKLCKPSDIFNTIEYLRNTEYVNGTEININGGII